MSNIKIYRLVLGVFILTAVSVQYFTFRSTLMNFLSYFTVISSLLAAFSLIISATKAFSHATTDMLRGMATLYTLITGLGFIFLLGGQNEEFLKWTNIVVHYISPFAMLLDWIYTPSLRIPFRKTWIWIFFLILYLVYSITRGLLTSWYPYGFLNPQEVSYFEMAFSITILTGSSIFLSFLLTKLNIHRYLVVNGSVE